MIFANSIDTIWSDPKVVYAVAVAAVVLLVITIWLFRRAKREGRAAGTICLVLSVILHGVLIWLVPYKPESSGGGQSDSDDDTMIGLESIEMSTFDPNLDFDSNAGTANETPFLPLPVDDVADIIDTVELADAPLDEPEITMDEAAPESPAVPESLDSPIEDHSSELFAEIESALDANLDDLLVSELAAEDGELQSKPETDVANKAPTTEPAGPSPAETVMEEQPTQPPVTPKAHTASVRSSAAPQSPPAASNTKPANIAGPVAANFANRVGMAKRIAIEQTGGDAQTEAAVRAALRFLADAQNEDGSWDPQSSGAGEERRPLGEERFGAGKRCTTALTGLSLLAMIGAGNTHQRGEFSENVYLGLSYLIQNQHPNGSLEGNATLYAASYCHSMAALAVCEDAVMTGDPSAVECARRALAHTKRMQHPVTGGWRYTRGDPGDLSQLGWQAMVLHAGKRAGVPVEQETFAGVDRFLRSVRVGRGGLACYRPGEQISRTMTAEALAIRLLNGEAVPPAEVDEAERYLLQRPPGVGQDNYYYWYYATMALHQLQDDAWSQWNTALKQRVLSTQRPDGSWPNTSLWGGYGGTVYSTAMATLCLETYYRHTIVR
ncbi:squalene--hopene cyclase [Roseiconus lacunae]|uniref:squalene--hopene cyclase n=1 Tax=Roseiconus lacunae TaxID=2605694 RepID=UPI001E3ED99F|nr:squalene--hopene cyclase [Roseiconus lacunae]MCD0459889.1 squalene--hopene cyclase [Roseiconus lacunae]